LSSSTVYKIPYIAIFNRYSQSASSTQVAKQSREFCDKIKNSRIKHIDHAISGLSRTQAAALLPFFENATLLPIPRSSLYQTGSNWPSKTIADRLLANGFGKEVVPCIKRTTAVSRSAFTANPNQRPTVAVHASSMSFPLPGGLVKPDRILLIDDVITKGSTSLGCVDLIKKAMPEMEVNIFSIFRTVGKPLPATMFSPAPPPETLYEPVVGSVFFYKSGKTFREP